MKRLALLLISLVVLTSFGSTLLAQTVSDFSIDSFHGRYELFNDSHGGRMLVTENLSVTYSAQNHGILRAVPATYKKQNLDVSVHRVLRNGLPEEYTSFKENDNEVIKIGSPTKTINGNHSYEITYELTNVIGFYDTHDEWYWDINGDDWDQTFMAVSGEVIFPQG